MDGYAKKFLESNFKNPEDFLGVKENDIVVFSPGNTELVIQVKGEKAQAKKIHQSGVFCLSLDEKVGPLDYQIKLNDKFYHDPYAFETVITDEEVDKFKKGEHYDLYNLLGAHKRVCQGVEGIYFSLWAPNAKQVLLKGEFTSSFLPMRWVKKAGIFELFIPFAKEEDTYFFEIHGKDGTKKVKTDPFGYYFEKRPDFKAKVFDVNRYEFRDQNWIKERKNSLSGPINIYEVHLGSWKKEVQTYRELAHSLASYIKKMGYTHVELLPITEHPLDESWGYQVTGFFAPTSRFGSPYDFQYFVDYMHLNNIGVIIDWVPGHFPLDQWALERFDGTNLYEHEDKFKGFHPVWNTAIFDYSKPEVVSFLINSALFFLDKMHVDGIRVDAVSSMLFLDHERNPDQWKKNIEGTNLHLEAFGFIKHLNEAIKLKHPDVLMIAEEATDFKGVTKPVNEKGLGFDLKWNMGFMNDTLKYFSTPADFRQNMHGCIDFSFVYLFNEKFLLPFSHDEVVYGKKSLLSKMAAEDKEKQCGLLLAYQMFFPGKKLLFMGQEIAQKQEWDCKGEIAWTEDQTFSNFVARLNHFYLDNKALWEKEFEEGSFQCLLSDQARGLVAFIRGKSLLCLFHLQEKNREKIEIDLGRNFALKILFECEETYKEFTIEDNILEVTLDPLSFLIFEVSFDKEDT